MKQCNSQTTAKFQKPSPKALWGRKCRLGGNHFHNSEQSLTPNISPTKTSVFHDESGKVLPNVQKQNVFRKNIPRGHTQGICFSLMPGTWF